MKPGSLASPNERQAGRKRDRLAVIYFREPRRGFFRSVWRILIFLRLGLLIMKVPLPRFSALYVLSPVELFSANFVSSTNIPLQFSLLRLAISVFRRGSIPRTRSRRARAIAPARRNRRHHDPAFHDHRDAGTPQTPLPLHQSHATGFVSARPRGRKRFPSGNSG